MSEGIRASLQHRRVAWHDGLRPYQLTSRIPSIFLGAFACVFFALWAGHGVAQIYKVTDDENGVVFTDRPEAVGDGSQQVVEELQIKELNTATPIDIAPVQQNSPGISAPEPVERRVTISSPADESTIAMGPGNFSVVAAAEPALAPTERLVLLIDGQPVGAPQDTTSWYIEGALRGPHDLQVQRTSRTGQVIASSESVRIYVLRPSLIRR